MSHTIYNSKAFTLTEYCGKNNQIKMQITQGITAMQLNKIQVCKLIDKLKEWIKQ